MNIINVEKKDKDGKLIMKWRNDPITRKMSFNQSIKKWETFKDEFYNNYFKNIPLFAIVNNEKIAFISFVSSQTEDNTYYIGINISPEYRGKKLACKIINKSIEYLKDNIKDNLKVIAEIKKDNIPSIKTFIKSNFIYHKSKIKQIYNTPIDIVKYIYLI